jgi:hypothetical protein
VEFLNTLSDVRGVLAAQLPDLLLCSGWSVYGGPRKDAVLQASGGIPVLYEREDENLRPWVLAWGDDDSSSGTVIRERQLFAKRAEEKQGTPKLLGEFAAGKGVVRLENGTSLLLFSCGENLALGGGKDMFTTTGDLPKAFQTIIDNPWIVLNPSHQPYFPHVNAKGFAKVGFHGRGKAHPPIFQRVVNAEAGARAPIALVHVNNIDGNHRSQTAPFSSLVFMKGRAGPLNPIGPPTYESKWAISLYEIPN